MLLICWIWEAALFIILAIQDLFYFFRNHPAIHLDLEQHKILCYVETRWLSILPVTERVFEQLAALRELFKSLNSRKDNKSLKNQPRFKCILCALNKPE